MSVPPAPPRTMTPLPSAVTEPSHRLDPERTHVVVVTGLSGAGKSTALHALEDLGYFCIDNLPTVLAPQAISLCEHGGVRRVALGIDMRVRAFLGEVGTVLATLGDGRDLDVLFFDASDEAILTRFSETRRRHPLDSGAGTNDHTAGVIEGVRVERERLSPLRARATQVVDTTRLSVHDLRRSVIASFGAGGERARRMATRLVSFGFKYGPPVDADMVLDVRFLQNPYFVPTLKKLPGTDARVIDFVMSLTESQGVPRPHARSARILDAALRTRGKELLDHRHRLHRRNASLRRPRRRDRPPPARVARDVRVRRRGSPRSASRRRRGAPSRRTRISRRLAVIRSAERRVAGASAPDARALVEHPRGRGSAGRRDRRERAMSEVSSKFMIVNNLGLHARAATKLVHLASRFPCEVEVLNGDQSANGKSVMGVLLLCGSKGTEIEVRARGEQAHAVRAGHRGAHRRPVR